MLGDCFRVSVLRLFKLSSLFETKVANAGHNQTSAEGIQRHDLRAPSNDCRISILSPGPVALVPVEGKPASCTLLTNRFQELL